MKVIATFFLLKAFRCRECGKRNYFPSFMPNRRTQRVEFLEESATVPVQAEMLGSQP
ncbi:MAG: hypothetical protein JWO20_1711 [Candidatus Angelobacter sp.]|nr:hypothetical protein [Candidatus Angelobacter sp.]